MQSQLIAVIHLTTIRRNAEGNFKEASDCFRNVRLRPGRLLIGDRRGLYSVVRFAADELWVSGAMCATQSRWPSMPNRKQLLPSWRLVDLFKSQRREKKQMTAALCLCEEASLNIMLLSLTSALKGMIQNVEEGPFHELTQSAWVRSTEQQQNARFLLGFSSEFIWG